VRKADNLLPSCAVVTKSGNVNFLEPSGPLRACNGTALSFTTVTQVKVKTFPVHDMKAYRGVRVWLHSFLTSTLDGGEW